MRQGETRLVGIGASSSIGVYSGLRELQNPWREQKSQASIRELQLFGYRRWLFLSALEFNPTSNDTVARVLSTASRWAIFPDARRITSTPL